MQQGKMIFLALTLFAMVFAGCETTRRIDFGEVSEQALGDQVPGSHVPCWATGDIAGDPALSHEQYFYFIGISQEQAPSEYEAIQQAYLDAVRRVADALAIQFVGSDQFTSSSSTETEAEWPNLIRRGRGATHDWERESEEEWRDDSNAQLLRDSVLALATIADAWVTREWGQQPEPVLNMMKYEELWKAKVLIRIPRQELLRRMERVYQLQNDQIDFEREMERLEVRLAYEHRVRDADLDFTMREKNAMLDYEIQRDSAKLDLAIRKAEAEARLAPVTVPQPTFSFMNNSYWYGYGPGAAERLPYSIEVKE